MVDLDRRIVKLAICIILTVSLAFVRISAIIVMLFLGLVGFQAFTQHAHGSGDAVTTAHADHDADVEHAQKHSSGHAGHDSSCWAHATCSPAAAASMNGPNRVDMPHQVATIEVLDYSSYSFSPSSPPPRA